MKHGNIKASVNNWTWISSLIVAQVTAVAESGSGNLRGGADIMFDRFAANLLEPLGRNGMCGCDFNGGTKLR